MAWSGKGIRHLHSECRKLRWSRLWSAPSSSLQVTSKLEDHFIISVIHKSVEGWANGPTGTSRNSARINTKSCTWKKETPTMIQAGIWLSGEQLSWEGPGQVLVDGNLGTGQQCALVAKTKSSQGYTNRRVSRRFRVVIIPISTVLVRPHLESFKQFWVPKYKKGLNQLVSTHGIA